MEFTEESRLIAGCKQGDAASFGRLYDVYFERLYRFIYYRTQHQQTAEDLVSQAFMKAWEKIQSFDATKARFATWLYQIARNLLIDHYRKTVPIQNIESAWDIGEDARLERDAETALLMKKIRPYLDQLTPQQRQVLIMRIWDDLPYAEIAQILKTSEAACKMAFSRAIDRLQGKLMVIILFLSLLKIHH